MRYIPPAKIHSGCPCSTNMKCKPIIAAPEPKPEFPQGANKQRNETKVSQSYDPEKR